MVNRLLVGLIPVLFFINLGSSEIMPKWTKQFEGQVRHVDISNDGKRLVIGVNYENSDIPESLMFSIFCLRTLDGEAIWNKELQGYTTNWMHYFSQTDNYLVVHAVIPDPPSLEVGKEVFLYMLSNDGRLLWKRTGYYDESLSPHDIYLAEYVPSEQELD